MEQKAPLISVIVPIYNAGYTIWDCLTSIREQTVTDWEVIMVDDGSTDRSLKIIDWMVRNDERFRAIHIPNSGVSAARNAGIDAAKGKYLVFVDSDDLVQPTYFEKMLEAMETLQPDLVLTSFERFRWTWKQEYLLTKFGLVWIKTIEQFLTLYTESRTNMFGVSIWAKMYRADLIREHHIRFDPEITYEEDCNFNADYLAYVHSAVGLGDNLYRYRQSDQSLSKAYRKDTFRFLVHGLHRRQTLLEEHGMDDQIPKLYAIFLMVIKTTAMKIAKAPNLKHKERIEEYRVLMQFPESIRAASQKPKSKSFFNRCIAFSVRHKMPRLLAFVMRIWRIGDSMKEKINDWKTRIRDRRKPEENEP